MIPIPAGDVFRPNPINAFFKGERYRRSAQQTHGDQDKIYCVLEGSGRFSVGGKEERLGKGEALVAEAGIEHGLFNDGSEPMLVLVMVTPPPPHGPGAQKS